jgi:hypothetical protein
LIILSLAPFDRTLADTFCSETKRHLRKPRKSDSFIGGIYEGFRNTRSRPTIALPPDRIPVSGVYGRGPRISSPPKTAIFRQANVDCPTVHHDALEFPDGDMVLLTYLMEGQEAVVLQLPATGSKASQRAAFV